MVILARKSCGLRSKVPEPLRRLLWCDTVSKVRKLDDIARKITMAKTHVHHCDGLGIFTVFVRMSRICCSMSLPLFVVALLSLLLFLGDHFFMPTRAPSSGAAHALSQSTVASKPSTTTRPLIRILCYGDSLTAGTTNDYNLHPYAPFLEQGLRNTASSNDRHDYNTLQVRHVGLPGWTAQQMTATLTTEQGLVHHIRRVTNPSLSLVILLAGTNDLGHGSPSHDIVEYIVQLHETALDNSVPATLAIGIPPSAYTSHNSQAKAVVDRVNANLQSYSEAQQPRRVHFVPFPFEYQRNGDDWSPDGLHLSPKGYQRLGESLVDVVKAILKELDLTSELP
jgi:lysophospholipase L1-like esterase